MRPNFLKTLASLLTTSCLLTIFAIIPTHSLVIPDEFSLGERGITETIAWSYVNTESHSVAGDSDIASNLVPRRIQKRTLKYTRVGGNKKRIKYDEYDYPSLDQIKEEVFPQERKEILANGVNILYFYSNLDEKQAILIIRNYFQCADAANYFPEQRGVGYSEAVETQGWMSSVTDALASQGYNSRLLVPRLASQALAEQCSGRVFFFTRGDQEPGDSWANRNDNTWVGWEFPALTRNPAVTEIIRIDPRPGQDRTPKVIWTQGDAPVDPAPRGVDPSVRRADGTRPSGDRRI
ncbi:hypothetical protein F5883DRAFT_693199 [Diaporthe sp. PMI_573]|nr:hypothetical protein F5883DRAFT_693199 [Diaporthaceae sp. PMI_573]